MPSGCFSSLPLKKLTFLISAEPAYPAQAKAGLSPSINKKGWSYFGMYFFVFTPFVIRLLDCVFVNLTVLHDYDKVFARVCHKIDVLQRIAVHQDQVSQRAFFHHAQLSRVGIAGTA